MGLTRTTRSTWGVQPADETAVFQRATANLGISARECEQLDQIVGLSFTNPEIGTWLIRFPHLVLALVGLPMPRAFAALMCAPDLADLKDLALRSVALIDEFGMPDHAFQRIQPEQCYMSDNLAS